MSESGIRPPAERRRSGRLHLELPIRITWTDAGSSRTLEARTLCISQFGCGIRCPEEIPAATRVTVEHAGRSIEGTVSYVLRSSAAAHFEMGIGFLTDGSAFWDVTFS